jgi:transposase
MRDHGAPTLPKTSLTASFPSRREPHAPLVPGHITFHKCVGAHRADAAALEKAAEIRKARAELKDQLKQGKTTLAAVLERAEADDVVGKLKVSAVLQALPGIGKIRATQIMEKLKIADSRRLRGLGEQQRKALLGEFASN